jgi:hypothetical protein
MAARKQRRAFFASVQVSSSSPAPFGAAIGTSRASAWPLSSTTTPSGSAASERKNCWTASPWLPRSTWLTTDVLLSKIKPTALYPDTDVLSALLMLPSDDAGRWRGTSPHRADRPIQAPPTPEQREEIEEARTKEETCREYLREILRDGPVEVRLVKTELGKAGFAVRTVERAARGLGVKLRRDTEGGRNTYSWELGGVAEAEKDEH